MASLNIVKLIGLGIAGYGFLVLANPSQYAQQFVSLEHAPILGLGLILLGIYIALKG